MTLCQEEMEQGPKVRVPEQEEDKAPVTLTGETFQIIRARAEVPDEDKALNSARVNADDKAEVQDEVGATDNIKNEIRRA